MIDSDVISRARSRPGTPPPPPPDQNVPAGDPQPSGNASPAPPQNFSPDLSVSRAMRLMREYGKPGAADRKPVPGPLVRQLAPPVRVREPRPPHPADGLTYNDWADELAAYFIAARPWPRRYGPAPGEPGCRAPKSLLLEYIDEVD